MKSKALLAAVLLAATNFAWAQGGLSIDNAEATGYMSTDNSQAEIIVQGPIDQFDVDAPRTLVDTDQFKNTNSGRV